MKKILSISIFFVILLSPYSVSPSSTNSTPNSRSFLLTLTIAKNTAFAACPPGSHAVNAARGPAACFSDKGDKPMGLESSYDTPAGACPWYAVETWVPCLMYAIGSAILVAAAEILYFAGLLLNLSIYYSVIHMADWINNITAIKTAWTTFRDLANIFFIFVLLYIGVSTILNLKSRATLQLLIRVILIALVINFSLFFTKVIIDTSNIVTVQFYTAFAPTNDPLSDGLSAFIAKDVKFTSLYSEPSAANGNTASGGIAAAATQFQYTAKGALIMILGAILFLIAAFIFLAGAILFFIRFIVLIFLIITSPIAYVAAIIPSAQKYSSQWWDSLLKQCIWAPVFMMFMWVNAMIIGTTNFGGINPSSAAASGAAASDAGKFVDLFVDGKGGIFILVNFIIVMGLLVAALIVAQRAGASGSSWATKVSGGAMFGGAAWLSRNTIGRSSNAVADRLKNTNFGASRLGQATVGRFKNIAESRLDFRAARPVAALAKNAKIDLGDIGGKGGYVGQLKDQVKAREEYAKGLGKTPNFASDEAREAYDKNNDTLKGYKAQLDEKNKEIADAITRGLPLDELSRQRKAIEKQIGAQENVLKEFTSNKTLGVSKQEAFASRIANDQKNFLNALSDFIVGPANKEASKKIRESQKKNLGKDLRKLLKDAGVEEEAPAAPAAPGAGAATP